MKRKNHYNNKSKEATIKYMKEKLKQLNIRFKKDEYEEVIKPLIDRSGLKPITYIKLALKEKLNRDYPGELPDNAITTEKNIQGEVRTQIRLKGKI